MNTNDDCYFYYYSTCTKGSECPYRHCEAALGTETVCTLWRNGNCLRQNCKFRHMESRIKRTAIPCYWENQPGGCRKPHCVFFHQKTKVGILKEDKTLILPMADQSPQQIPANKELQFDANKSPQPTTNPNNDSTILSPSIPVEPVVVTFNDCEDVESDTESMTSTPVKLAAAVTSSIPGKSLFKNIDGDDFGIKTLEQLRMEKIHRESAHFYNSVYDAPNLESAPVDLNNQSPIYQTDLSENDRPSSLAGFDAPSDVATSSDLRALLKRKKECKSSEVHVSEQDINKRVISFKRAKKDLDNNSCPITVTVNKGGKSEPVSRPRDFQIKTLHEIRKEKNKKEKQPEESPAMKEAEPEKVKSEVLKLQTTSPTSKLKRPAQELYQVRSPLKNGRISSKADSNHFQEPKKAKLEHHKRIPLENGGCQTKENDVKSVVVASRRILRLHRRKSPSMAEESKKGDDFSSAVQTSAKQRNLLDGFKSFLRHPLSQLESRKNSEPLSIVPEKTETDPDTDTQANAKEPSETNTAIDCVDAKISEELSSSNEAIQLHTSNKVVTHPDREVMRTTSVDEFEQLLLESDCDLDEEDADNAEKTEDIFLELEEMLNG